MIAARTLLGFAPAPTFAFVLASGCGGTVVSPPASAPKDTALAVSVGSVLACAVTSPGGVACWGNDSGDAGPGSAVPVLQAGLAGAVTSVATGSATCAVTAGGGVECWGDNSLGQLGDGTTIPSAVPVAVTGLTSAVVAVSAGPISSCALTSAGTVECWGGNNVVPTTVGGIMSGATAVSVGVGQSCAVVLGGVACWINGLLGDTPQAVHIAGLPNGITAVSVGQLAKPTACALTADGSVECWETLQGAGGVPTPGTIALVSGFSGRVTALSVGQSFACAIVAGGGVECWGDDSVGELGNASLTNSLVPVPARGLSSGVTAVSAGQTSACAVLANGGIACWGQGTSGQLGNGSAIGSAVPTRVTDF